MNSVNVFLMSRLLCFKSLKFLDLLKSSKYFSVVILLSGLTLLTPKIGFSQTSPTVILNDTDADNVLAASDTVKSKYGRKLIPPGAVFTAVAPPSLLE